MTAQPHGTTLRTWWPDNSGTMESRPSRQLPASLRQPPSPPWDNPPPPLHNAPPASAPDGRVAARRHPHAGVVVRVDLVLYELSAPVLVHVDAARLTVVDVAPHHRRVRARLHLEARDPVVVDVVRLKVPLRQSASDDEQEGYGVTVTPMNHTANVS